MASNYIQPGKDVDLTAPTGGVTTGVGVLIGNIFGIAHKTAAAAAAFVAGTAGIWKPAKTSAQAWAVGEKVYWDNTNARADNALAAGFRRIGVVAEAAANPSSTGKVRLDQAVGPIQPYEAAPAAASIATAGNVTLTAAQMLGGIIVRDCAGAGRTDTLPTAALLVAAMPGVQVGDLVRTLIVNGSDAAEAITLAAGTGGAFDANQTAGSRVIAQNDSKLVMIRITNVTAASEAYVVYA